MKLSKEGSCCYCFEIGIGRLIDDELFQELKGNEESYICDILFLKESEG